MKSSKGIVGLRDSLDVVGTVSAGLAASPQLRAGSERSSQTHLKYGEAETVA